MSFGTWVARFVLFPAMLLCFVTLAAAEDISGTINGTKTIVEDSQLVGNVTCTTTLTTGPCIQFGAPNIKLRLRGFTITGPANPDVSSTCNPTSGTPVSDGISTNNQTGVEILGPGMVQKFKRHGIFVLGTPGVSTGVTVKHITSHHNCFSGLLTNMMSNSVIEGNVSVRNAANSGGAPCGANCLVNSNDNHIWLNVFGGNGSPCPAALCTPGAATVATNNDFGVGLIATSSRNLIESNTVSGNTNGILVQVNASGNIIRQNIIAGNPPSQVSRDYGPIGFDVKDESATGRNTFERNWCVTYFGPGPAACPNFPAAVPPTISEVTATPDVLWPPNHEMVPVTLTVAVSDDADPAPVCQIATVSSNEAITTSDWLLTGPLALRLRADRDAGGTGRIYTITVTCTNSAQLTATETVTVNVPHDQRK